MLWLIQEMPPLLSSDGVEPSPSGTHAEQAFVFRKLAMINLRHFVVSILPGPVRSALRPWWRSLNHFKQQASEWTPFITWLVFQCAWHRKKAVIICRCGALGDVVCTLPMCGEIRKRHAKRLITFVTATGYRDMVLLSRAADLVYGGKSWNWGFSIPTNFNVLGLVAAIYNPKTTDERFKTSGATCHLVDDLAGSCGLAVTARQPRLYPSSSLIKKTRTTYGLGEDVIGSSLIIGINGGPSWPVRMWNASKWQKLINKIHSEYDAVIIQFGTNKGDGSSEYDNLTGVQSMASRLQGGDIVALIAICDLIVSIDSGPVHLAGTVGTPVVGLFGPVNPLYRLPPESPGVGLFSDVPCLFCHNRTPLGHWYTGCPNNISCMRKLDDQTVFEAVKSMLSQSKRREVKASVAAFD
jgi:ADP-heptose:LPS heptosyltransferase